jgi:predicted lipoprotein with Yx(FWY)xxD motif
MTARKILDRHNSEGAKRVSYGPARVRLSLALPVIATAAAAVAACSSAAVASSPASTVSSVHTVAVAHTSQTTKTTTTKLKTAKIGSVTVLTTSKGFTLYSFAPDTTTMSKCNGTCAQIWPPVKGPATAAGVKGKFGTIKRADGSVQATYKGHPLYTFTGDTAPKQAKGNGLNVNGGVWHEVTTSGTAKQGGGSSSGSGGGGGY